MAQMALIMDSDGKPILPPVSAEDFSDNTDNIEFRCCGLHNTCLAKCVLVRPSAHRNYFRAVEPHKKGCLNKSGRTVTVTQDDLTGEKFDKNSFFSRFRREKKGETKRKKGTTSKGLTENGETDELDLDTEMIKKKRAISSVLKLFVVFCSHKLDAPYGRTVKEMRDLFFTRETGDYHLGKGIMGDLIVEADLHSVARPNWLIPEPRQQYMWMESVESETGKKFIIVLNYKDSKVKNSVWNEFSTNNGRKALIVGRFWRYRGRTDAYITDILRKESFVVIPPEVFDEIAEDEND